MNYKDKLFDIVMALVIILLLVGVFSSLYFATIKL